MPKNEYRGPQAKYDRLLDILHAFNSVAVAFSGGIDSTFLLHAACDALGNGRVTALQGISCLLPTGTSQAASLMFERNFSKTAILRQVELHPLLWNEFVANDGERCYFCKKRTYSIFKRAMVQEGRHFLLDGTNADDLQARRPGLRAVSELGVQTPLLNAGLNKYEIRELARIIGLENHNLPSNSCLATRVATNIPIQTDILKLIDDSEHFLHEKGFHGCRVRPGAKWTVIEVRKDDLEKITLRANRVAILNYFQTLGLTSVVLNLQGRE